MEYFIWGCAIIPIGIFYWRWRVFYWRWRVYKEEQRRRARGYRSRRSIDGGIPDKIIPKTPGEG